MKEALDKAIKLAGGQAALARACGVTQAAVWSWYHKKGYVPGDYVPRVEAASGVCRSELRPDLWAQVTAPGVPSSG